MVEQIIKCLNHPKFLWSLLIFGIFARLLIAVSTRGTQDIRAWESFGELISLHGLYGIYALDRLFNHPPLGGMVASVSLSISNFCSFSFYIIFKLIQVFADIGSIVLVWHISKVNNISSPLIPTVVYSLSLPAILVAGFHGNTDPLCVFFLLFALFCTLSNRYFSSGIFYGLSFNIKIIPILFLPAILFYLAPKLRIIFLLGFFLTSLPFIGGFIITPYFFFINIFKYRSIPERWGIGFLANSVFQDFISFYQRFGGIVLITAIIVTILYTRKKMNLINSYVVTVLLFIVLAPGFGVQYLMYIAPLAVLFSTRDGAFFSIIGGLFLIVVYQQFLINKLPLETVHQSSFTDSMTICGIILWTWLLIFLIRVVRRASITSS
jgi:hypothetical protein